MEESYKISMQKIIEEFHLETIYLPDLPENIFVTCSRVNRPGLQMVGFYDHYEQARLQIIGKVENLFVSQLPKEERSRRLEDFFRSKPSGVIITTSIDVSADTVAIAEKYQVPILRTAERTSDFMAALIAYLNVQLGPRITRHGVLVEVYGEGILIVGDSGVGKSETAVELINRGHRLIADDAVEIRRVSSKSLVGTAPDNIRHFIELRGVGIINAGKIFGVGAIKITEKIDMVVKLELWNDKKVYDRLGLEDEYTEILGIRVPVTTVPVKPGRNLAIIIETAAMNNRQKRMGYNAAKELMQSLGMSDEDDTDDGAPLEVWH